MTWTCLKMNLYNIKSQQRNEQETTEPKWNIWNEMLERRMLGKHIGNDEMCKEMELLNIWHVVQSQKIEYS